MRPTILATGWFRITCVVLQCVLPGTGALLLGFRNPHTTLARFGVLQLLLVAFGSWPLIFPGVIGVIWAWYTAFQIHSYDRLNPPANPYGTFLEKIKRKLAGKKPKLPILWVRK